MQRFEQRDTSRWTGDSDCRLLFLEYSELWPEMAECLTIVFQWDAVRQKVSPGIECPYVVACVVESCS